MVNTLAVRKFRLGILDYLSRDADLPGKFPSGKKIEGLFIYISSEISGFWGVNGEQPVYA